MVYKYGGKERQNKKAYYRKNKTKILQYRKKYYLKNRKNILQNKMEYHKKNREKILERMRLDGKKWYQQNKEKVQLRHREYYRENKEKIAQYHKEWYQKSREKISQQSRAYYQKNRKRIQLRHRRYNQRNKERILEYKMEWQKYKRRTNPKYRLNENIGSAIARSLKDKKAGKKWEDLVGYTVEELMKYLKKKFDSRMSWNNYGSYWAVDHIKPKSLFKYTFPDDLEFKQCWDLENLQPLAKVENIKKRNYYIN